ncbi:MAG: hypothetical protein HY447_03550 [Candidatus Omnitrophica bacterium]|nr:hypothetical protein [Candidatus Omnitrophota bacterium]
MKKPKPLSFCIKGIMIAFFAVGPLMPNTYAQALSGEIESLKKIVIELQQQISIQGEEIASLKNKFEEKAGPKTVFLPPKGDPAFKEHVQDVVREILLSEKELTPEEKRMVTLYDDGFWLKGKDDTIRIGGWSQADLNIYEKGNPGNTRFRNRRTRLDFRGVLEETFGYQIQLDFSGGGAGLQEAWLEYKQLPAARLRVGQFKVPFSLEAMHSSRWIDFVEPPIGVSNLQPAEDLGAMIYGTPWEGRIDYAFGVFNGRRRLSEDNNDAFDLAGRLVLAPFRKSSNDLLKDLYFGGSVTTGSSQETLGGTSFTTAGGTSFFTYSTGARHPDNRTRLGGEFQWIYGPGDIKVEYISGSFSDVDLGDRKTDVNINSWYASATYVLTGERKQRNKPINPKNDFNPSKGVWGAWELGARYEEFLINGSPLAQGFATGTDRVDALSFGINWWPNIHTRFMLDYVVNLFEDDIASGGETMDKENLILLRTQYDI